MNLFYSIAFFGLLLFVADSGFSQRPSPLATPPKSTIPQSTKSESCLFSERQLDKNVANLPPGYRGNNLKALITEMIRREKFTKDEFETTKQFLDRIENEKKKNFSDDLNPQSNFSFELGNGAFRYDADSQLMNFEISLSPFMKWFSPCRNFELGGSSEEDYQIFVDSVGKNSFPLQLSFKINVEKARRTKPSLRVLSVGKIKQDNGKFYLNSTGEYALIFSLDEIWLFDEVSGEVFLKYKPDVEKLREDPKKALQIAATDYFTIKNLYEIGRDDEAIRILRQKLASEPMDARAYFWLGKIHLRQGDVDQAISSLKSAIFWENKLIESHILLAQIYLEKGECLQAKNYSALAAEIDPENIDAIRLQRQTEKCPK